MLRLLRRYRLAQCLFKEDNDFLQCSRVFHTGNLVAVRPEHQRIGPVAFHLEPFHKRGAAIPCVQVRDNELIGRFCELPVRGRVLLEDPAMLASERVEQVDKDGLALLLGSR